MNCGNVPDPVSRPVFQRRCQYRIFYPVLISPYRNRRFRTRPSKANKSTSKSKWLILNTPQQRPRGNVIPLSASSTAVKLESTSTAVTDTNRCARFLHLNRRRVKKKQTCWCVHMQQHVSAKSGPNVLLQRNQQQRLSGVAAFFPL